MQNQAHAQRVVALTAVLWLVAAAIVGATGWLALPPRPVIQGILLALTVIALIGWRRWPTALEASKAVRIAPLVRFHAPRLILGGTFLLLLQQGKLPRSFALPAGVGDMIVGALGLVALAARCPRRLIWAWNFLGLLDITGVVLSAGRAGFADPGSMSPLTHLPLSLLPTWYVPLVIATHIIVFWKLREAHQPSAQ